MEYPSIYSQIAKPHFCAVAAIKGLVHAGNTVNILWVPGHTGVLGNERADELARPGSATV